MKRYRRLMATTAIALALSIAACTPENAVKFEANEAQHFGEVGMVRVSVISKAPWSDIASDLPPGFQRDPAQALQDVVPTTTALQERLLDALGVSLALAFTPGSTPDGEPNVPESPPTAGNPADLVGTRTAGGLAGLGDENLRGVLDEIDPITKYRTANALLQEIAILNKEVQMAAHEQGYVPYFVRLQLSTFPYVRYQPYDLLTQVHFYLSSGDSTHESENVGSSSGQKVPSNPFTDDRIPTVIPLLVTDNLEASAHGRTASVIRQLALAVSVLRAGVGGSFGLNKFAELEESVFGRDINSLLTVGKVSENGIVARIGARRNPDSNFELSEGSHAISLLLLVPADSLKHQCEDTKGEPNEVQVKVFSDSELRHATERVLLPDRPNQEFVSDLTAVFEQYQVRGRNGEKLFAESADEGVNPLSKEASEIVTAVQVGDYRKFVNLIVNHKLTVPFPEAFWAAVAGVIATSSRATDGFDLPSIVTPTIVEQTPVITVNKEGLYETILVIGEGAAPDRIEAVLKVPKGAAPLEIPAIALHPGPSEGTVRAVFPSLTGAGVDLKAGFIGSMTIKQRAPTAGFVHCDASKNLATVLLRPPTQAPQPKPKAGEASAKVNISIEADQKK